MREDIKHLGGRKPCTLGCFISEEAQLKKYTIG